MGLFPPCGITEYQNQGSALPQNTKNTSSQKSAITLAMRFSDVIRDSVLTKCRLVFTHSMQKFRVH